MWLHGKWREECYKMWWEIVRACCLFPNGVWASQISIGIASCCLPWNLASCLHLYTVQYTVSSFYHKSNNTIFKPWLLTHGITNSGRDLKHLDMCFHLPCVLFLLLWHLATWLHACWRSSATAGSLVSPAFSCPCSILSHFGKLCHLPVILAGSGQFKLMTEIGSRITCSTDNNSVAKDSLDHFQVLSYVPRHGGGGERAPGIHTVCACALL